MKYYLYCFFLLVSSLVFSQNQKTLSDSEYQKLHDKARILINSDIDSSFICANKIQASNSNLHKSFAYGIKSYLYQRKDDSISSKKYYKIAIEYLNKLKPSTEKTKLHAYLLSYKGLAEWKRGNLNTALEYYLKGKKLSVQVNDIVQIIKFNNNISLIYFDIQNYKLSIKTSRESDLLVNKYEKLYTTEQLENNKSNIYLNLGNSYWLETYKTKKMDSAAYFFQKTIIYSKNSIENKILAQLGISGIYELQKRNVLAEKSYMNVLFNAKTNKLDKPYYNICYNVGRFYFQLKKYDKSVVYFNKVDSINSKHNFNTDIFVNTNYYLSKIYEIKNDPQNAVKYSKIYLDNFEKSEYALSNQTTDINSNLEKSDLEKEMIGIQKKFKNEVLIKKWSVIFSAILFIGLVLLLVKNIIEKNRVKKKVHDLINEFSFKIEEENKQKETNETVPAEFIDIQNNKPSNAISIDEAKELEIITKLKALEDKKFYLKAEFNQKEVAKKLKTNTTYLSYVVNKNFKKSFSEYSNELKINYVINEMINNPTYRKYSTQAIAESVGFKNAISFTKSFNKRTGVTPVQFIKGIN
jgi:AraC-like DNA-binding protein